MPDDPKIIVDDDWKKQARAEKAKLAESEKAAAKTPPSAGRGGGGGAASTGATGNTPAPVAGGAARPRAEDFGAGGEPEGPYKVDFAELLRMLGTQALMYLGQFPDPQTGKAIIALDMAKVHIDLLGVLEDKTKGNLTADEARDMAGLLTELRMVFVEISRGVAKAMKEGRIGPRGEMRAPAGGLQDPTGLGGFGGAMGGGMMSGPMSGPGFDPSSPGSFPVV